MQFLSQFEATMDYTVFGSARSLSKCSGSMKSIPRYKLLASNNSNKRHHLLTCALDTFNVPGKHYLIPFLE